MSDHTPDEILRPLRRVRQVREFTTEPPPDAVLDAIADVGRWTGSAGNIQPWRFIVIRDEAMLRAADRDGGDRDRLARSGRPRDR